MDSIYSVLSRTHKLHGPFLTNNLAVILKFSSRSRTQDVLIGYITVGGPPYPWLIFLGKGHKLRTSSSAYNAISKGYYEP